MKTLETQIEALENQRIKWLMLNLIGFITWDGFRIIDSYFVSYELPNNFQFIFLAGWLIWIVGLIQLIRVGQKVKKSQLASQILNDELVELGRLKSWKFALVVILFTQAVIIILCVFSVEISGMMAAEISIFTGVVSAISAFIYHEKSMLND